LKNILPTPALPTTIGFPISAGNCMDK